MIIKTVTVKQIQKLDKIAIERYGVASLALMEIAGRCVTNEVLKVIGKKRRPNVFVICGLGNNAGDGFVIARHLINRDVNVKIMLIGRGSRLKQDALANYTILKRLRHPIQEFSQLNKNVVQDLKKADCVVDAIFGVGLNREVRDSFYSVIEAINQNAKKVLSVDTPSGLDGTTGKIYGICVKATRTVTFTFIKRGFLKNAGPKYTGKIIVVDIGIPKKLQERI